MPRPKVLINKTTTSVILDQDRRDFVQAIADERKLSFSWIIRDAIDMLRQKENSEPQKTWWQRFFHGKAKP